jgi:hypothetical protein
VVGIHGQDKGFNLVELPLVLKRLLAPLVRGKKMIADQDWVPFTNEPMLKLILQKKTIIPNMVQNEIQSRSS